MFSIAKFFSGFNIFNGEKFGKILYHMVITLIILALVAGVWYKMFYQRAEVQQAGTITNITQQSAEDAIFIGVKIGGLKLGLRL